MSVPVKIILSYFSLTCLPISSNLKKGSFISEISAFEAESHLWILFGIPTFWLEIN